MTTAVIGAGLQQSIVRWIKKSHSRSRSRIRTRDPSHGRYGTKQSYSRSANCRVATWTTMRRISAHDLVRDAT